MNSIKYTNVENRLFVARNTEHMQNILKICHERLRSGQVVVLFTVDTEAWGSWLMKENIDAEALKRFIIINCSRVEAMTSKLLELHDWVILPQLVILDLLSSIRNHEVILAPMTLDDSSEETTKPLLQAVCLCIAAYFSLMEAFDRKLRLTKCSNAHNKSNILGIVVVNEDDRVPTELLVDLYFYNNNAYDDFSELQDISRLSDSH